MTPRKVLVFLFAALVWAHADAGSDDRYIVGTAVNLRENPSEDAQIVATLPIATKVELKRAARWALVVVQEGKYRGRKGWALMTYLDFQRPTVESLLADFDRTPAHNLAARRTSIERALALDPANNEALKRLKLVELAEQSERARAAAAGRNAKLAAAGFDKILHEVRASGPNMSVKRMFELDRDLESIVGKVQKTDTDGVFNKYWRREYEELGLFIGHYSNTVGYSGKFLVEAHKKNPNSPYRKYTLFTTILGESDYAELSGIPNIKQARRYLKEFPHGPYASNTYAILGSFYDDLSKVLKQLLENDKYARDYKYDCFAPYVTKEPYAQQFRRARDQAILNLEKAISADPGSTANEYLRGEIASIKSGTNDAWGWCTD